MRTPTCPVSCSEVLEGKLGAFGKRVGHMLFKLSVDQAVMSNLVAFYVIDVDLDTLRKASRPLCERCKGDQRGN